MGGCSFHHHYVYVNDVLFPTIDKSFTYHMHSELISKGNITKGEFTYGRFTCTLGFYFLWGYGVGGYLKTVTKDNSGAA